MMRNILFLTSFFFLLMPHLHSFFSDSPEMEYARSYIEKRQWQNALGSLETEVKNRPHNAEAWFLIGKVYNELWQYDNMLEAFERASEYTFEYNEQIHSIRYRNWVEFVNIGIEYYNLGLEDKENYYEAIHRFKLAVKMNPSNTIAYKNWGYAHLILGEPDEALIPFKEILKREYDPEIAKYTGQIYYDKGYVIWREYSSVEAMDEQSKQQMEDYMEESIKYIMMAMESAPEDSDIVATLSNAYIVLERRDEAIKIYRRGIETDPNNKIYHYNLGVLILQEEQYEEAMNHFDRAIEIDQDYSDAYYNLGVTYLNWGVELREKSVAERDYEETSYLEKFEQALTNLQRVIEHRPNDSQLWETLGRLYKNLDRVQESEDAFERADRIRQISGE